MLKPPSDESVSAGLWVVLARAYRSMSTYVEHSITALGVGLSDFMILEALLHKGPLTMSALCDAVLIANASMTAAVDRLEKKQFVERVAHETDRRARLVRLTAEGTALARRLYSRHLKDLEELMGYLPITDRMQARETLKTIGLVAQDRVENGPLDKRQGRPRLYNMMKLIPIAFLAAVTALAAVGQTPEGTRLAVPGTPIPVEVLVEAPYAAPGDLQIVCLFASAPENKLAASLATLDTKLSGALTTVRTPELFRGTLGETLLITPKPGAIAAKRLLLIGLGDRDSFTPRLEEFVGEIAYAESERLGVAAPTFAPTILDGGKTGIDTGTTGAAFLRGFLRARSITLALHAKPAVQRLTFLAGTTHAVDTQRGMAGK